MSDTDYVVDPKPIEGSASPGKKKKYKRKAYKSPYKKHSKETILAHKKKYGYE